MSRIRLDEALVQRGFYGSRARARDAVLRGKVLVAGLKIDRPGQRVEADAELTVSDEAHGYVSRAALKLLHALDHFRWSPEDLAALDIGASTGGFTQVLLDRGARHVTAIDVGHGQLASILRDDPRVTLIEGLNARNIIESHLAEPPAFLTADVSFISLALALPPALALAAPHARLIALIKPQFEAGPEAIGKGGIVRSEADRVAVCGKIASFLELHHWLVNGIVPSPISGSDGNMEYLIAAEKAC